MQSRRSGDRRRRVLRDDVGADLDAQDGASDAVQNARRNYSDAAKAERQLRITDLIPIRKLSLFVLILGGMGAVIGIASLQLHFAQSPVPAWLNTPTIFSLDSTGTIASWFATILLFGTAAYGCLTFMLRRHKTNDYKGRYRLWLWVVPVLALLSLDASTHLLRGAGRPLAAMAASHLTVSPQLVFMIGVILLAVLFCARLGLEMREGLLAPGMVTLAGAAFTGSQLMANGLIPLPASELSQMYSSCLLLSGQMLLFLAVVANIRHVYLDAQELLPAKSETESTKRSWWRRSGREMADVDASDEVEEQGEQQDSESGFQEEEPETESRTEQLKKKLAAKRAAKAKAEADQAARDKQKRQAAPKNKPKVAKTPTISKATNSSPQSEQDDDPVQEQNLSKAERRRLRKLKRRENRAA